MTLYESLHIFVLYFERQAYFIEPKIINKFNQLIIDLSLLVKPNEHPQNCIHHEKNVTNEAINPRCRQFADVITNVTSKITNQNYSCDVRQVK